ncbi:MAG: gamma-glutamyl-gamma-aminobutyrate hydrolase family protein [Brockia lithotrophica]|nr:gamma-glutamyl-gamma-aminobutyrate hydrolase family protein [Brockia lithotrophica]
MPRMGVGERYARRIREAGGVPIALLPPESPEDAEDLAASAVDRVDGLLLAGGYDVDPAYYGEAPASGLGTVEPLRDTFEIALVRVFRRAGRPILGICRGAQVLNVALGGTLYQDIPGHNQSAPRPQATHPVFLAAESRLFRIVGGIRELAVNSFHHQAVRTLALELVAVAYAPDGTIEAVEAREGAFLLGVQWHPEWLEDEASRAIFRAFVSAVGELPPTSEEGRRG